MSNFKVSEARQHPGCQGLTPKAQGAFLMALKHEADGKPDKAEERLNAAVEHEANGV